MANIEELPSDIIFEILIRVGNLRQLWCTISSCPQLYQAFDQRRSLILQQVIKNQLHSTGNTELLRTRPPVESRLLASHIRRELAAAQVVIDRCRTTPQDALSLHAAAWDAFSSLDNHLWLDCYWGQQLVDRYAASGKHEQALQCARALWKRLTGGHVVGKTKPHRNHGQSCYQGAAHSDLAQKLAIMYLDAGRDEDAIDVLRTCYELIPNFDNYGLLSAVMGYYRASDRLTELQLVPFFQECILKDRTKIITGARGSRTSASRPRFHFTYCLVMVLTRANRHAEAIDAMNAAVDLALQDTSNTLIVGLSRKLIRMLQEQHRFDEALTNRKRVLDVLTSSTSNRTSQGPTSQLIAWAKEYTSDLRMVQREEEAINIEKDVWNRLRTRAGVDRGLLYRARNAAWTLAKSYKQHNDMEKAAGVRLDYEGLVNARHDRLVGDTQLLWPGSTPDAGLTKVRNEIDIPIMVTKRELWHWSR